MKKIYLDNAATTRLDNLVIKYINDINTNYYGNPSSLHNIGLDSEKIIKKSRNIIANALNVLDKEIIFTSGGTESNNLAIKGYVKAHLKDGNHIITSQIEHPSVIEVYKQLSKEGFEIDIVDVDDNGYIDLSDLSKKINKNTILISIILVNNEIGTIQNMKEIIEIKNKVNSKIGIHFDAIQAFGKIDLYPKKYGVDLLSISAHKIKGPKGIGALYVKNGILIKPLLLGGGQEHKLRSGTENVAFIGGFALATEIAMAKKSKNYIYINSLKEYFINKIKKLQFDINIISCREAIPYIVSVGFSNIKAEVLLHHLEMYNIFVSTGSACSSKNNKKSHVIKAIKVNKKYSDGIIRFSFSEDNTFDDINYTIDKINEIIPKISIKRGVRH
ncbi:MAG: cysteine desulfurase family protein [Clostridiales bacterium]